MKGTKQKLSDIRKNSRGKFGDKGKRSYKQEKNVKIGGYFLGGHSIFGQTKIII